MALSRNMLKGLDLEADVIQKIIDAHMDTVEAKQKEIDEYKKKADKYDTLKTEYDTLKADSKSAAEWEKKYNKEHEDFEEFKKNLESEKESAKVKDAYKARLEEKGISSKVIEDILKITDYSEMKLDKDGKLEDVENIDKAIEEKYSGFKTKTSKKGAGAENPPTGTKNTMTKEEIEAIKDPIERQAKMAENINLYVEE